MAQLFSLGHIRAMDISPRQIADTRVFDWLDTESQSTNYHLIPLHLSWTDAGVEHDLAVFRKVADRLASEPAYWAEIIREASWRHSLVGCTCLLASHRHELFEELCYRFRAGSFVAPQIAVTLGLLHGSSARLFFESVLDDPALRSSPKLAVSAHRVLLRLGAQPTHDISIEMWRDFDHDDAMIAEKIVAVHWDFWFSRV